MTSITLGLVIVFSLHDSSTESTSKHKVSPVEDLVIGLLLVAIAWVLRTGRDQPFQDADGEKGREARGQAGGREADRVAAAAAVGQRRPKMTFVVGAVLSFPGVSYLDALDHIHKLNPGTVPTVLLVVYFCVMQQMLLELPLLGYVFAPDETQDSVNRFRAWMARKGRTAAIMGAAGIGIWLIARGPDHAAVSRSRRRARSRSSFAKGSASARFHPIGVMCASHGAKILRPGHEP